MIRYFDYRPEYEQHREEFEQAIHRVLDSGQLILGPEVDAFESEFAEYVAIPHAVAVGSGTDAISLALRGLEIGSGDEVITTANAGVPPIAAIRAAGATPRLVDVDPRTLLLDPERLDEALTDRVRAILAVHLYGQPVDMAPVLEFAARHELRVIEDCAQAHGAFYRDQHVGTWGDVASFSFYPTKNLGAFGDGGICVTGDRVLAEKLRMLRMYGYRDDAHSHCEGLNSRLDELQAAILRVKLQHLDGSLETRRALAARYREGLDGSAFRHPDFTPNSLHAYHLFVVEVENRVLVCERLTEKQIGFGIHYALPVHEMEAYRFLARAGQLDNAETASRRVISLPLYPGLLADAVDTVVAALRSLDGRVGNGER